MAERKVSPEQWIEARRWQAEGITQTAIAKRLGVCPARVSTKLGGKGTRPQRRSRSAQMVELYRQGVATRDIAELLGTTIGTIRSVLRNRKVGRIRTKSHRADYSAIVAAYEAGLPVLEIMEDFGLASISTIYHALAAAGLKANRLERRT